MVRTESQGNACNLLCKIKRIKKMMQCMSCKMGRRFSGAALRKYGLPITWDIKEYEAMQYYLHQVKIMERRDSS